MKGIIIALITTLVIEGHTDFVPTVSQNYNTDVNELLVEQINLELTASYIYSGYASYFQRADVHLPGFHSFFSKASLEERQHAKMITDYVNKRGGDVKMTTIEMGDACKIVSMNVTNVHQNAGTRFCICQYVSKTDISTCTLNSDKWEEGLIAMEDALAMEHYVNTMLLGIHSVADNHNDAHLSHFLEHEMLEEQINAIYELGGYVTRLRHMKKHKKNYLLGEYLFDKDLQS